MLLQLEQVTITRYDQVSPSSLSAFQYSVVCLIIQHSNRLARPYYLRNATDLFYVGHYIPLWHVELFPECSGEFGQDGRRRDEDTAPLERS